ncbi:MAG TPA: zinc ribbon domain-containing protein, partial [Candidatus Bathyarchaeia archaeon]|nr:zinc ribbon domain-containing protein [Candidatus Bathyarchaeia archaeon]
KAKREGVPLKVVESKNTSRQCPDKRNRKTRSIFECLKCGYMEMADYVAACNIAARAAVNQHIVAPLFSVVTNRPEPVILDRPPVLTGGS